MILAGAHATPEAAARFLAEAETIARLEHPHIVRIHHIGETDGLPFFELEFAPGGSLDGQLDGTPGRRRGRREWPPSWPPASPRPIEWAFAPADTKELRRVLVEELE